MGAISNVSAKHEDFCYGTEKGPYGVCLVGGGGGVGVCVGGGGGGGGRGNHINDDWKIMKP